MSSAASVRSGTFAALAWAGVSLASQPDSVKVNKQTPPAAAPWVMNSRLEFVFDIDPCPARRLVRLLVASTQRREIESLYTRVRIGEVLHIQVDLPLIIVRAPTQSRIDHRVGGELIGREVAQVIEEAVGIVSTGTHVHDSPQSLPVVAHHRSRLHRRRVSRLDVARRKRRPEAQRDVFYHCIEPGA